MPINLEEHVVFIDRLQMDMVPLSIAKQAIEEAYGSVDSKIDEAMNLLSTSISELNKNLPEIND